MNILGAIGGAFLGHMAAKTFLPLENVALDDAQRRTRSFANVVAVAAGGALGYRFAGRVLK